MKRNILFSITFFKVNFYAFLCLFCSVNNLGKMYMLKNEINLTIKGTGQLAFINKQYDQTNFELIVNGIPVDSHNYIYKFENDLNNVTIKFNSPIESCKNMFNDLENIIEVDLSNFDASKVTNMDSMFFKCINLEKINFGNINTSLLNNMNNTFHYCYKLASLDLSNFDTSSVTTINSIFRYCTSLTSINVSNFNTKNMVDMLDIFALCHKLTSADLSSFDTSKVTNMRGIFYQCYELKRLDLRNFNTSSVTNIIGMFGQSNYLVYINLYSFVIREGTEMGTLFDKVSPELKICINDTKTKNLLKSQNPNLNFNCLDICFKDNIKIDLKSNKCVENCNEIEYKYEYNNYCYKKCPEKTYIPINNEYLCLDKTEENNYYYDVKSQMYKECYYTCKSCKEGGNEKNNNCIECKNGFMFLNDSLNNSNCYEICKYYYYFNKSNNKYICTEDLICQGEYNKLIKNKKKCIDECYKDDIYKYEYNNICYEKCPNGTNESNYICSDVIFSEYGLSEKDEKTKMFKDYITKGNIIEKIIQSEQDFIEKGINITYQITTSDNQKNNANNDISSIDLGTCEEKLKGIYDINKTLPLIIFKIDYYPPYTLIPIVGYEIYHPINKSKLDLSYCENMIKLNIPSSINETDLFKYNPNSGFYNDECYSYTTEDGTDIILNDRKQEFKDNNLSLCQNGCDYKGYNINNKQSSCECYLKNEMDLISEIFNDPNKLSNNFDNNKTISSSGSYNIATMKCTNALFTKDGLKNNISSYIFFIFIFYFMFSIILFIKCGYSLLEKDISDVINSKNNTTNKNKKKKKIVNNTNKKNKNKKNFPPKKDKTKTINFIKNINIKKEYNRNSKIATVKNNLRALDLNKINNKRKLPRKSNILRTKNINARKLVFNDFELNTLKFEDALSYDKRTFCEYYMSLLKTKHPLIFSFCPIKDYNLMIIKLCIFCLSFSLYYSVNYFFFDEEAIHKIYKEGGKYDMEYFIPKISIAFAISHILSTIFKYIFLSERNILQVRMQPTLSKASDISWDVKRRLKIKYVIFYILGIIILGFFWILLSSFGAVYQNTQIIVIENTLISFALSLVYPFFINIFPCIFRLCSFNNKSEYLYSFSKLLQLL